MNRRSFIKTVTGIIAGLFTLPSLAKEKPKLTVAMLQKAKVALGSSPTILNTNKWLVDPTEAFVEAEAKVWAKRSDKIILTCMNA